MNTSAPIVGLFGSSHIYHYPLDLFHSIKIHPIVISSSPRNIAAINRQNTVQHTIKRIQRHNITLDKIVILIGGNDIGTLTPIQIIQGIIHIANSFSNINIQPIIVPIFNRLKPFNITESQYNTGRNKINKHLRLHYKKLHQHNILRIHNLRLDEDGVHLTRQGYITLTKAIKHHITPSNIPKHIIQLPPGHYHHNNEEIIINIVEEKL